MNEHEDLVVREDRARLGNLHARGGAERDKLARQNKLFVRDRLALLFDEGTFVEDGLLANTMAEDLPADGVVTGQGRVDGRPALVVANDPTVKAGSWGARTVEKIVRVMRKVDQEAPHAVLLVLDATVGQNALSQVEIFGRIAGVTGLVMTKLDGTARGGILVAIAQKHQLPVHFIGVGEGVEDLEPFEARDFARAIAGLDS